MNRPVVEHTAIRPGVHRLTVVDARTVTPLMRRVTARAPTIAALPLRPAQDVGLVFTDDSGREIRRRYTITDVDPVARTLVLDGVLHGDGPGANWFASAVPGDEVSVVGPRGKIELAPDVNWHLFVGDESGLPAFTELLAVLPEGARATAVIEIADAAEEQPMVSPAAVDVRWVHRDGRAPGMPAALTEALNRVRAPGDSAGIGRGGDGGGDTGAVDTLGGGAQAYVLGESRAVVALGPALAGLGITRAQTFVKGYWNRPRGL
jgi:NADPH-dependent ferric siderophore reductase